jgi:glycosyltransferase involved in cell wall biosynthesis
VSEQHEAARAIRLSATVIAQDEEARLGDCLDSLSFCDEVLVIDGGSRDRTRAIAEEKGARVLERKFDDFASQHAFANQSAKGRWILSLDADERVSPELAKSLRVLADTAPESVPHAAYSMPFLNHFRGVPLRHGGLWPDRHLRFFRPDRCRIDPAREVHEKLLVTGAAGGLGSTGQLAAPVLHYGWTSFAQALQKTERYADAAALAMHAKGKRGAALRMIAKPLWRFFRFYFLQLGFLDGTPGALVAALRAYEAYAREARLWELSHFADATEAPLR